MTDRVRDGQPTTVSVTADFDVATEFADAADFARYWSSVQRSWPWWIRVLAYRYAEAAFLGGVALTRRRAKRDAADLTGDAE